MDWSLSRWREFRASREREPSWQLFGEIISAATGYE